MEIRYPIFLGTEGRQGWGMTVNQPQMISQAGDVAWVGHLGMAGLEKTLDCFCCLGEALSCSVSIPLHHFLPD